MKGRTYHCLFEQSGTFKNEIIKLGGAAKDYDCLNDYGQTDVVCDLYDCIDRAYLGITDKVFSKIKPTDFVLAFFPCTRFECQISMTMLGNAKQYKDKSDIDKLTYNLYMHKGIHENYERITKLAIICLRIGVPLVIENPANEPHYLTRYWCLKPTIKDSNRRDNGDYMVKPTNYWFVGCEPKQNCLFEQLEDVENRTVEFMLGENVQKKRSEIHPQYASRFIKQYIADMDEKGNFIV